MQSREKKDEAHRVSHDQHGEVQQTKEETGSEFFSPGFEFQVSSFSRDVGKVPPDGI